MSLAIIGMLQKTSRYNRPRQIAVAIVWGCVCGLIPKSSLLFALGMAAAVAMPIHLIAAILSMLAISLLSIPLHSLLGNSGHWLLSSSGLGAVIQNVDKFPLVPWLKLHNTTVIGALAAGSAFSLPVYLLALNRLQPLVEQWNAIQESESAVDQASVTEPDSVSTNDVMAAQLSISAPRPPLIAPQVEPQPLAAALDKFDESMSTFTATQRRGSSEQMADSLESVIDSIHALENLLENARADQIVDASAVLARANQASDLVDDILQSLDTACDPEINTDFSRSNIANNRQVRIDSPQVFHSHDTKISIYRRARTGETTVSSSDNKTPSEKEPMPTATDVAVPPLSLGGAIPGTKTGTTANLTMNQTAEDGVIHKHDVAPHEEALRHLLNHLRALKEKV